VKTELVCEPERDVPVSVVRVTGRLSIRSAPVLREAVHKMLADQPELILIDVSGLDADDDIALTALPMLAGHAGTAGIAIILLAPSPALRAQLHAMGISRRVPVATSRSSALELYARMPAAPRFDLVLPPQPSATTAARLLVDDACRRWRLGHLADTTALIVTELVANGIQHAGTQLRLSLALRQRHLHVAVRDGSSRLPRRTTADDDLESGRGLIIIDGLAAAWGCLEVPDGKVVWAMLRRTPRTPRRAPHADAPAGLIDPAGDPA
jgi:anti-anti-sigma regulatory factor/anti-sigma regulatory factor (Ser/Thr protein kinase)